LNWIWLNLLSNLIKVTAKLVKHALISHLCMSTSKNLLHCIHTFYGETIGFIFSWEFFFFHLFQQFLLS